MKKEKKGKKGKKEKKEKKSEMDVAISGTDGIGSLNGSMLRAPTVLKAPSEMDVAPWCYK